jgi:DNA-binding protein YbaB
VARFEFDNRDAFADSDGTAPVVGVGEAADGRIRAVIGVDGRLSKLDIAPDLLRHNRHGGTLLDCNTLAAEIAQAVNDAINDFARRATAPDTLATIAELSQIGDSFESAVNQVTAELERAERRLDGR